MKRVQENDVAVENELVDIKNVVIRQELPREERIKDYLKQIKNPYLFRFGDIVVEVEYARNGISIDDCLREYIKTQGKEGGYE